MLGYIPHLHVKNLILFINSVKPCFIVHVSPREEKNERERERERERDSEIQRGVENT